MYEGQIIEGRTTDYELVAIKEIRDWSGFLTEYSLWKTFNYGNMEHPFTYFTVYGDTDIYGPAEDEDFDLAYADWETGDYTEAIEFFDTYEVEDEYDD